MMTEPGRFFVQPTEWESFDSEWHLGRTTTLELAQKLSEELSLQEGKPMSVWELDYYTGLPVKP